MTERDDPVSFSLQIRKMFSAIAPRYDLLNRLLSCGQDRYWRKVAVKKVSPQPDSLWLDLATGTGDVALEMARRYKSKNLRIVGVDFSLPMLALAGKKLIAQNSAGTIHLQAGAGENLAFRGGSFDGITIAFGIRNFSDMLLGLKEMRRVLNTGGKLIILEFSFPKNIMLKFIYRLYFDWLLPVIGRIISGHRIAYGYLSASVSDFPVRERFVQIMEEAGFKNISYMDLTFGIVTLYIGYKDV